MKYGLAIIQTPDTADPATVGRLAEEAGFDSIWIGEHPAIPVEYKTPYPLTTDGEVPEYYHRMFDPFVSLGAASAVTSRREPSLSRAVTVTWSADLGGATRWAGTTARPTTFGSVSLPNGAPA